jgi:hypothetical protein
MKPLIQREPVKYQSVTGMMEPTVIREFRGVNTFDPFSIADGFFTDMSNMTTDDYPAVSVRPGYSVIGTTGTKVLGLGSYKDQKIVAVFNDGSMKSWDGSTWTTLKTGLSTSAMFSFAAFEGNLTGVNLIGANGVDGLHRYDGSTVQTFGDAPADINYITSFSNRLWGGSGKELRASSLDKPDKWNEFDINTYGDEASYAKDIESTRGENINFLSGELTKLVIGMPNSRKELYGNLPSDFNDRLISDNSGFANNNSAVTKDGVIRSMHNTGIYEYVSGGMSPNNSFSEIVERYTQTITSNAAAGFDGVKQYFSTDYGDMLVYDPRSGVQAWSVWNDIQATCFLKFQNDLYIGDNLGRVLKLGGTSDNGTAINWYAITKPFTNGSIAQKQRWIKLWTVWELAVGTTLNVYLSNTVDGNDWELVHTVTGAGLGIQRVIVPIQKYALVNTIRVKFEGTGWARMHEHSRQVRQLPLY